MPALGSIRGALCCVALAALALGGCTSRPETTAVPSSAAPTSPRSSASPPAEASPLSVARRFEEHPEELPVALTTAQVVLDEELRGSRTVDGLDLSAYQDVTVYLTCTGDVAYQVVLGTAQQPDGTVSGAQSCDSDVLTSFTVPVRADERFTRVTTRMPRGTRYHLTVYGRPAPADDPAAADPGSPAPAQDAPAPDPTPVPAPACDPAGRDGDGARYEVSQTYAYLPPRDATSRAYADPGTTITIAPRRPFDVDASPQTTASVDADAVLARLSEAVGVPVTASASVQGSGVSGAWTVPADQPRGWLEVGGAGYQVQWRRGTCSDDGTFAAAGHGTVQGATSRTAFTHS